MVPGDETQTSVVIFIPVLLWQTGANIRAVVAVGWVSWVTYWWFADDVIKKHEYANYDQFGPNFDMAHKTKQGVSVPNLKLIFGTMKAELWAKEVGEFSIML